MPRRRSGPWTGRKASTLHITRDQPEYRQLLRTPSATPGFLAGPSFLLVRGSISLPPGPRLGLVCSVRMKGTLIVAMYEYAKSLRPGEDIVVGGFHSPMERQVLEVLLAGHVPVVVVPARNPDRMRIPLEWRAPMDEGRLTIVSGIGGTTRRPTRDLAVKRNLLVAALSDCVLVPYATPGGVAELVARTAAGWGMPLRTFRDEDTKALVALGATEVERANRRGIHDFRAAGGGA